MSCLSQLIVIIELNKNGKSDKIKKKYVLNYMMDLLINNLYIIIILFFLIYSIYIVKHTLPDKYDDIIKYVSSKHFLLNLLVLVFIIIIIYIKLKIHEIHNNTNNNYIKLKGALISAITAFLIAFYAKFELVFIPFYFIFITVYFIKDI
jgi:magnesium-transporting ATPase (P-type)